VAMRPDVPYFIILLCLTPDNFTHQGESAATQWVKHPSSAIKRARNEVNEGLKVGESSNFCRVGDKRPDVRTF
jgi:hypothetical protein